MTPWILIFLMGLVLGLLGGGGGILTVPILVYFFSVPPELGVTYSLFVVGVSALIGLLKYQKHGHVQFGTGVFFALPAVFATSITRQLILPQVPEVLFEIGSVGVTKSLAIMLLFSAVMLASAIAMIRGRESKVKMSKLEVTASGGMVGLISGLVGAGGGFLIVPVLTQSLGLRMKDAIGTSLFIISLNSLAGFLMTANSKANLSFMMMLTIVSSFGIGFGSLLNQKIPEAPLKRAFGYFVFVFGLVIFFEQLSHLTVS